jgi:hypothetical protein
MNKKGLRGHQHLFRKKDDKFMHVFHGQKTFWLFFFLS